MPQPLPSPPPIDGSTTTPSLRTLGRGSHQALNGDTSQFPVLRINDSTSRAALLYVNGHVGVGGDVPSGADAVNYLGVWLKNNVCLRADDNALYQHIALASNIYRISPGSGWGLVDTALPGWVMQVGAGINVDSWSVDRTPAAGNPNAAARLLQLFGTGHLRIGGGADDGVHQLQVVGSVTASGAVSASNLSGSSSGSNTGDVTLGTANGLSLTGQALSLAAATGSTPGAMSAADKTNLDAQSGTNSGDLTIGTANGLSLSGQALSLAVATGSTPGALSAADKTKLDGVSGSNSGDITIGTANGLSLSGQALSLAIATDSIPGAMSAADHANLTALVAGGSGIDTLTGDVTAGPGAGSQAATVAFVGGSSAADVHAAELLANAATSAATASTLLKRDANGNARLNALVKGFATTVTSGGTTTLTVGSAEVQLFTGSTTHTLALPDATTLVVGQAWTVKNASSGAVAVNGNGGSLVLSVPGGQEAEFTVTSIGSSAGAWDARTASSGGGGISALTGDVTASGSGSVAATIAANAVTNAKLATMAASTVKANVTGSSAAPTDVALVSAPTASAAVIRDSSGNARFNNAVSNFATTATAAGTTTLTVGSAAIQQFTGTSTQTVKLPDATTLPQNGFGFTIINRSTGAMTLQDGGSSTILTIPPSYQVTAFVTNTGSTAGTWDVALPTFTPPVSTLWDGNSSTSAQVGTLTQVTESGISGGAFTVDSTSANALKVTQTAGDSSWGHQIGYLANTPPATDYRVRATFRLTSAPSIGTGNRYAVGARVSNNAGVLTGYFFAALGDGGGFSLYLAKDNAGSQSNLRGGTQIGTIFPGLTGSDKLELEIDVKGSLITCLLNRQVIWNVYDSSFSGGTGAVTAWPAASGQVQTNMLIDVFQVVPHFYF